MAVVYFVPKPPSTIEVMMSLKGAPLAIQYGVTFALTLGVTIGANAFIYRFIRRHGAAQSELAATLDLNTSAMKTAVLRFLSTTTFQVC